MNKNKQSTCIFCKVVAKQISAEVVYEDDKFIAFLDINPRSPGHLQIIPREHYRWVWDVPEAGQYFEIAQKLARAMQKTFNQPAIWSRIMGDEVEHAHVWLFPHQDTVGNKSDLAGNATKIKQALK